MTAHRLVVALREAWWAFQMSLQGWTVTMWETRRGALVACHIVRRQDEGQTSSGFGVRAAGDTYRNRYGTPMAAAHSPTCHNGPYDLKPPKAVEDIISRQDMAKLSPVRITGRWYIWDEVEMQIITALLADTPGEAWAIAALYLSEIYVQCKMYHEP